MILDLDVGNSNITWQLAERAGYSQSITDLQQELASLEISQVRLASVRQQGQAELITAITQAWGITPDVAQVQPQHAGLTIAYDDPSQLGVDRWLAMLALVARDAEATWLLLDCGTALTVDLVQQGKHLGGYILPGSQMMNDAFYQATGLPQQQVKQLNRAEFFGGQDTASCVTLATELASHSFIKTLLEDFMQKHPAGQVVFTGGNGKQIAQDFQQHQYISHLVCAGLAVAF